MGDGSLSNIGAWVAKKVPELVGMEEPDLVEFIMGHVRQHAPAGQYQGGFGQRREEMPVVHVSAGVVLTRVDTTLASRSARGAVLHACDSHSRCLQLGLRCVLNTRHKLSINKQVERKHMFGSGCFQVHCCFKMKVQFSCCCCCCCL